MFHITDEEFIELANKSDLKWPVDFESEDLNVSFNPLKINNIIKKKVIIPREVVAKKPQIKRTLF